MRKTNRLLSLLLVGAMAIGLFGCGKTGAASSATASTEKVSPMEISYVSLYCGEIVEDNWAEQYVQDALDIEIKTKKIDLTQAQQRDLMLASNEMPDCGWIIKGSDTPKELYNQGVTRTIPWDMIEQYAPNYAALLKNNPVGLNVNKDPISGEYLALTGYTEGNSSSALYMTSYRYDWLQRLGIEPNGELIQLDEEGRLFMATEPFTQSEFTEILKRFTEDDPDGNGKDDTFGLALSQRSTFFWTGLYGMYNITTAGAIEENGSAERYFVTEKYKDFLKYMAELYEGGFIDQEFATLDVNQAWEKVANGQAGVCGISAKWTGPGISYAQTRAPNVALNQNPEAKVVIVPTEVNDEGKGGAQPYPVTNYNYTFFVNKNVSDEKLAKILEMFDFMNFDSEAKIALRYGEEGTHFHWTDEENSRGPVLNEGVTNGGETGLLVYNSNYIETKDIVEMKMDGVQSKIAEYTYGPFAKNLTLPYRIDLFNETQYAQLISIYGATLDTLVDEFFYNSIGGNLDIDAEWDAYIAQLESSGYNQIREELQKAPLYTDLVQ